MIAYVAMDTRKLIVQSAPLVARVLTRRGTGTSHVLRVARTHTRRSWARDPRIHVQPVLKIQSHCLEVLA
jgi:hypothetical protein